MCMKTDGKNKKVTIVIFADDTKIAIIKSSMTTNIMSFTRPEK
jgi:hypothetical protein